MEMYMFDTDICAFIMRGPSDQLARKLRETPLDAQSISVVTLAELLYGVRISARPRENRAALEAFVKHLSVEAWTEEAAEHYAEIRARLHKRGEMIGANDLLIAAHARASHKTLLTGNVRKFRRVPKLEIENWNDARR
jgi:tRNA(fMet)-specific endonuclease VapC